jgi:DNA-binding CsgD family transcriptional regulator
MNAPLDSFVGRLRELEGLRGALDDAIAGRGRIVMLAGEPGIGKTRTAQELALHAAKLGVTVLWGRSHEEAGAPPYWPWVQVIRGALRTADAGALLNDVGNGASDIADIVPEIRDLVPDLEPSVRLADAAQARFRMFESIRQLFASLGGRRAAVVVLDNLHWADAPSLRLLEFLAPEIADSRLLLLGTYRPTELSRQHPLSDALGGLARATNVARINLAGLSAEEVHDFVAAATATGARAPAWLATSLHAQTEGNPLFLREIVRFLEQQGVLGVDRATPLIALPPTIRIPEGVTEVIGRRLNLLSARCNDLLALAAVIGRDFTLGVLRHATGQAGDEGLFEALEEALNAHVIEEVADDQYQFTHNLIRMTLYDELRTPRRRQLHRVVGEALEALSRADPDGALPELARHFLAAGDLDKAIRYAARAGQRAAELLAFEDAVQFFQAALDAMEQRLEQDDNERCRLLLLLGEAQLKCDDFVPALKNLAAAADAAALLGDGSQYARAALAYEHVVWRFCQPADPPAARLLEQALLRLPESAAAERTLLAGALARAHLLFGTVADAKARGEQAIAMARQLDDPGVLATTLNYLIDGAGYPDSPEGSLRYATEALAAADQVDNVEMVHFARSRRLASYIALGDVGRAEAELEALTRLDARIRQRMYLVGTLLHRITFELMRGELAEAERLIVQSMALVRRALRVNEDHLSVQIFTLRREQGRLAELLPVLDVFLRRHGAASIWRPGLALLYLEMGQREPARSEFEQMAAADFAAVPRDGRWPFCMVYLSEICAALGDADKAAVLYRSMLPHAGYNILGGHLVCCGSADRYLGLLCATMSRWSDAERHFEAALAMNSGMGAYAPLGHTKYDYAAMLLARDAAGDRQRASLLLRDCLESARRLGMRGLEERAAARLARLSGGSGTQGTNDDLTSREIEVLRLIAIGRSNADIAMVLAISLNTVATHVRNILAKTGCANRTEAAAYAMRQGLADGARQAASP